MLVPVHVLISFSVQPQRTSEDGLPFSQASLTPMPHVPGQVIYFWYQIILLKFLSCIQLFLKIYLIFQTRHKWAAN